MTIDFHILRGWVSLQASIPKIIITNTNKTMKKYIFATAIMVAATFVAIPETATAQNSEVMNQIKQTCLALQQSQRAMQVANQKTYFWDKDVLNISFGNGEQYQLIKKIRRNATSGWALGVNGGAIQMAENFSPTVGLDASFAGKRLMVGAGMEAAISKYNKESSRADKSFFAPIFSARAGVIVSRFSLGGYDNMGWIALGYEFKYILDKNENNAGSTTYETETEIITTTDKFYVEGNSMCHVGFVEARFGLKHMGVTSLGIKAYAGAYNRYYQEGSRRKLMIGGSVSLYFSGAKKRTDRNVELLQYQLENMNNNINQMRANK
jgi:hypothetical protein